MAVTVIRRRFLRLFKISPQPYLVIILAVLGTDAMAGNWKFATRTDSSLSYIDNVNLAPSANAESSKVFELSPGFSLDGEGKRLQVHADYQLQGLFYSNNPDKGGESDSKYFHSLSASAKNELLERLLFVDAAASVKQQGSTEIGKGTADNYSITDDRGTVNKISISPYLLHQVGNGLRSELRYRYDDLYGDENIVTNSIVQTVALKMDSGNMLGRWHWTLSGNNREVDYESQTDQTLYDIDVGISRHIYSRTIVSLHGGTEKVKYHPSSIGETGGDYWMLGVDFKPGKHTAISMSAGDRYYGESYGFSMRHEMRHSVVSINYSEDLTNNSLIQLEQQIDEGAVAAGPGDVGVSYPVLNDDVILRKTLGGNIVWNSPKSTISLNTAKTDYDYKFSDTTERTYSAQASWLWRINNNLTLNLSDYYLHRKLEPSSDTELVTQAEMKLSRAIWAGASTSFSVVSSNRNAEGSSQDYSQKRFTLAVHMKW